MQYKTRAACCVTGGILLSIMAGGICHADALSDACTQKLQETAQTWGEPSLELCSDFGFGSVWLTGLTDVALIDFDQDGTDDLLLSYYCGGEPQTDEFGEVIMPGADDYRIEIWSCADGGMQLLCGDQRAGEFQNFEMNGEWSHPNCLYHVWEREGRPYLQIFEHAPGLESGISYTNIRIEDGDAVTEEYRWSDGAFTRDGSEIPAEEWMEGVIGDRLLHAAVLSEDSVYVSSDESADMLKVDADTASASALTYQNAQDIIRTLGEGTYTDGEEDTPPAWFRPYLYKIVESVLYNHIFDYGAGTELDDVWNALEAYGLPDTNVTDEDFLNEAGLFMGSQHKYSYALQDLDWDGIPELLLQDVPIEAGAKLEIYTFSEDRMILCDVTGFAHSQLMINDDGDVAVYMGHMGEESLDKLYMEDGTVIYESVAGSEPPTGILINEIPDLNANSVEQALEEYAEPVRFFNPASFFGIVQG